MHDGITIVTIPLKNISIFTRKKEIMEYVHETVLNDKLIEQYVQCDFICIRTISPQKRLAGCSPK